MADIFTFRQKPIYVAIRTLRIPVRPPEARQDQKTDPEQCQHMNEPEITPQRAGNDDRQFLADFDSEEEAPALPVFRDNVKSEQAAVVKTIGARMREARELCNMSQSAAARRLGYSNPSKLSKVEGATDTNSAPLWLIVRAARLYDVSIDFLFGASDDFETGLQRPVQTWLIGEWEKSRLADMKALEKLHRRVSVVCSLLPSVADEASRAVAAIQRFQELNPEFDDLRGGATLIAVAEKLSGHAQKAEILIHRFHAEIGADRSNQPTNPEGAAA